MADSTVRAGQDDEPEISCSTRKYGDSQNLMQDISKGHRGCLKKLLLAKSGRF